MVSEIKYRYDFIGLSTDDKPTPATSNEVVDGSTFYESNTSKLYVWYNDQWYEKEAQGGGGTTYTAGDNIQISSDNVISATDTTYSPFTGTDGTTAGASGLVPAPATTDAGKFLKADGTWDTAGGGGGDTVYSGVTTSNSSTGGAVYIGNLNSSQAEQADPTSTDEHYKYFWALPASNTLKPTDCSINILGNNYNSSDSVAIGYQAAVGAEAGVAIGYQANVWNAGSVALGRGAYPSRDGEVNIKSDSQLYGFNNTNYRVIGGVHDGQELHDAATVAQGNTLATSAPTTTTEGVLGQLYTDTTNMHTYQCTAISGDTYTWTQRW